jgi:hypothetical protein
MLGRAPGNFQIYAIWATRLRKRNNDLGWNVKLWSKKKK